MRRVPLHVPLSFVVFALLAAAHTASAQTRPAAFRGDWNYAVYAKEKSELPPAYQEMKLEEVPQFAIDITIRQTGNRLRAARRGTDERADAPGRAELPRRLELRRLRQGQERASAGLPEHEA